MDGRELNGKGQWNSEEDEKLRSYVEEHGAGDWKTVAREIDLGRSGNSCRLRWVNYLRSGIVLGNMTDEEWILILELHSELGNQWSKIAQKLPGRTDNKIKNFWNTTVEKEAKRLGLDANSREFRERMTETLTAKIQTAEALSSTTTTDDAYLFSQPPPLAAVGGGITASTFPSPSTIDCLDYYYGSNLSAQQFDNLGTILSDQHLADLFSSPPPPAVAGDSSGGSTAASNVPTLGYPNTGAEEWLIDNDFLPDLYPFDDPSSFGRW